MTGNTGSIIQGIVAADVPEIVIAPGMETSRRLVTHRRQGSEHLSFHITTYTAGYAVEVSGDGVHEVVMFCIAGGTTVVTDDGRTIDVTPGMALYLPKVFMYNHTVGADGLVMSVACTPYKE